MLLELVAPVVPPLAARTVTRPVGISLEKVRDHVGVIPPRESSRWPFSNFGPWLTS
jgi:hypothetical protein